MKPDTNDIGLFLTGERYVETKFDQLQFRYSFQTELSKRSASKIEIEENEDRDPVENGTIIWRIDDTNIVEILEIMWMAEPWKAGTSGFVKMQAALKQLDMDVVQMAEDHLKGITIIDLLAVAVPQLMDLYEPEGYKPKDKKNPLGPNTADLTDRKWAIGELNLAYNIKRESVKSLIGDLLVNIVDFQPETFDEEMEILIGLSLITNYLQKGVKSNYENKDE